MAFAGCSLLAPIFTAPAGTRQTAVQISTANTVLRGTSRSPNTGTGTIAASTLGATAIAVARMGQRRYRKISVGAAVPNSEPESESVTTEESATVTTEESTTTEEPPPPPPPPPFDPAKQVGAMAPLGFFDPAGFSKVGDEKGFNNLRAAEIKHGRVAMMAALGAVAQHYIKFPGFEKVPAGLSAVVTAPGTYGFIALLLVGAGLELAVWVQDPEKEPGNFGNPVGWGSYDDEMRNKEINNGRFAMFAALGIIAADLLTGKDAVQQFGA